MNLKEVIIENYRSIQDLTITFDIPCRVLVGKNEAGKSNILKALSMLNPDNGMLNDDLREGLPDEKYFDKGSITFVFTLNSNDINSILKAQSSKILSVDTDECYLLVEKEDRVNFKNIIEKHYTTPVFEVEVPNDERYPATFIFDHDYVVPPHLKKPKINTLSNVFINQTTIPLKNFEIVNIEDYPELSSDLEDIDSEYILECIRKKVLDLVYANLPNAIYWEYNDNYLLPSEIEIDSFISDTEYCLPLKSMFELANIHNIEEAIKDAQAKSKNGLRNLLERVSNKTTEHFRNVWSEYQNIQFELVPNGDQINASIKDSFNRYELAQRSDGFKRFVSFLLFISAKVKSDKMKNTLLLFDEPDLALHPSGQKYLRDELISISRGNYIVYSTHSIFMIDKNEISRHLIVEKKQERTEIKEVDESNFNDEEVIFNALGFSVFESLKEKNIIFEGWKDKRLFNIALNNTASRNLRKLKDLGLCHAKGVKDVKNISNILELADRKYIILSDNDNPAREKQTEYKELRLSGVWKRYDELVEGFVIYTAEDFLKPRCFVKAIDQLSGKYHNLPMLTEKSFNINKSKLQVIDDELRTVETDNSVRKKILDDIKNIVFDNLEKTDIEDSYKLLLTNLVNLI
ncbi:hypothetical protein AMS62_16775 [Bacillus sp. FJAT-18019]|nr:hypothetical protein AMS62_16775 [Bacillus sp. FJAT-18019]